MQSINLMKARGERMVKMVKYEDMPQSAQKAYKLTNNIRKILMFIGWIAFAGWFIFGFSSMIINHDITFGELLFMCYFYSGFVPGLVHCEYAFKGVFRKFSIFGIFFLPWVFIFAVFAGGAYLIADTILFIMKKPLVYPFEHKHFLRTEEAQTEMVAEYQGAMLDALAGTKNTVNNSDVAKNDLQNLKDMLNQGLITEEEFNKKKKELLERI